MAEATTEITVTPKQLGKHLRSIRRKKGLSLSEVARGAGLSRRELVNYERGKAPIPESDLWVLAGSCGVNVSDLMPATSTLELTAAASTTSVGDTVSALRKGQQDAGITAYLHTLHKLQALPAGKRIPVKEKELEEIAAALGSTPRSIEAKLREVLQVSPDEAERLRAMILVPPNGRGRPRALAAAPSVLATAAALEAAVEAAPAPVPAPEVEAPPIATAPIAHELVPEVAPEVAPEPVQPFPVAPAAFLDQPLDAPLDAPRGHNVDVFEELARLPEPVPLADPSAPLPDLLAPQDPLDAPFAGVPAIGPPEGAVELVDSAMPATSSTASSGTTAWSAADAAPIDVAMRQGSSTWDFGEPLAAPTPPAPDAAAWVTDGWQPPPPDGGHHPRVGFWEGTDDWIPPQDAADHALADVADVEVEVPSSEPMVMGEETWAGATWEPNPWVSPDPVDEWLHEPADRGAWDHRPDPAAVDTGFHVDWGTPETETPPGWDVFADATPSPPPTDLFEPPFAPFDAGAASDIGTDTGAVAQATPAWDWDTPSVETAAPFETAEPFETATPFEAFEVAGTEPTVDYAPEYAPEPEPIAELAPISWRAEDSKPALEAAPVEIAPVEIVPAESAWNPATVETDPVAGVEVEAEPAPVPTSTTEAFVTAGPDWQLGNALPLVEVQGQGGLVMRRADERWALADVTTTPDFVAEVELDFRSGPGLGVLFRASTDDEGRMSGYSFDIDPIYDGGGYLVRQWQADRELWNPIARVAGDDPTAMYGALLVRIEIVGEHLSARVNGVEVLTVENLKQASADRGRDGATGDRIGVQAWSSSDLVIDAARVACR